MNADIKQLVAKYNYPVPRYTSYPTVPHWTYEQPDELLWLDHVESSVDRNPEVSVYIHLPFCEKLCTYCGCNKRITRNHAVEERYMKALLHEWQQYLDRIAGKAVLTELHLGGGTPTFFSPLNLEKLISSITGSVRIADQHSFSFEAHPASTTKEHLERLGALGFNRVSIGVQDISEDILRAINRQQTIEQVVNTTKWARELGYSSVNYDIIYGLPFQTMSHISDTMAFIKDHRPDRIAFYSYAHVPWKSKGQRAFTIGDFLTGVDKYALRSHGHDLLDQAGYQAIGMDHYALKNDPLALAASMGQLHRNFMGYTERKPNILLGLGCSSISETQEMFVQNLKVVEDYEQQVNNHHLALLKGHRLSEEDIVLKKHITNLFCKGYTEWTPGELDPLFVHPDFDILQEMEQDGLLDMSNNSIHIKAEGRDFVRNICAFLDPNFNNLREDRQFSQAV